MASSQHRERRNSSILPVSATWSPILCCVLFLLLPHGSQSFLMCRRHLSVPRYTPNGCSMAAQSEGESIPYIVEQISRTPNEAVYTDIAEMCINVFFKESLGAKPEDKLAPWKEMQIKQLKTLQTADLNRRRRIYPKTNNMFLAYKVESATSADKPLILDLDMVENLEPEEGLEYVRGEVIGFVEITQKPYGLGEGKDFYDDEPLPPMRPILTNLAVKKSVRKFGVGSKLVDACEGQVQNEWGMGEIVLEVEDYNTRAVDFYSNRGFDSMYDDPASMRYDVGGLVLRKVRCTRKVMRKVFEEFSEDDSEGEDATSTIDADSVNREESSVSG